MNVNVVLLPDVEACTVICSPFTLTSERISDCTVDAVEDTGRAPKLMETTRRLFSKLRSWN